MSGAPGIWIRLPLEGRPCVIVDALHDTDEARLADWIAAHPDLGELVDRALELAEKEPAA